LSREFEPCAATNHGWVKRVEIDDGDRQDGLSREKREELRQERDILSKGRPLKVALVRAQRATPGLHNTT